MGGALYLAGGSVVDVVLEHRVQRLSHGGGNGGDATPAARWRGNAAPRAGQAGGNGGTGGNGVMKYENFNNGTISAYSGGNGGNGANGGMGEAGGAGGGGNQGRERRQWAPAAASLSNAGTLSLNTTTVSGTAQGGNAGTVGAVASGGDGAAGGVEGQGGIGGTGDPRNGPDGTAGNAGVAGDAGAMGAAANPGTAGTSMGNNTFGTPTSDTTPPTAVLSAADVHNDNTDNLYTFTIAYSDPSFVKQSTVAGAVVQVQPPTGPAITATVASTAYSTPQDSDGDAETITVTYQITPPGGDWNAAPTGAYTVKLVSNPPQDLAGNPAIPATLGTFNNNDSSAANLTLSTDALDLGSSSAGTPGQPQSYTISGNHLTAPITIAAPNGVELSDDHGSTFHAALTLHESAGTVPTTTIEARLSATAGVGAIDGNITNASAGAATQNVAITGTVTGPTVTLSTGTLSLGTTNAGTAGTAQSYTVSGGNLRAPILITAPAGVELSADNGATFHASLTLTPTNGTVASTTIIVRISAAAGAGALGGVITNASTVAVTQDITVSGTVNVSENQNGPPAPVAIKAVLGNNYSDPDGAANTKPGIAVIGLTGSGVWQFSANGVAWTTIAGAAQANALLLSAADSVRFVPTANWSGSAQLQYLAWDGSQARRGKDIQRQRHRRGDAVQLRRRRVGRHRQPRADLGRGGGASGVDFAGQLHRHAPRGQHNRNRVRPLFSGQQCEHHRRRCHRKRYRHGGRHVAIHDRRPLDQLPGALRHRRVALVRERSDSLRAENQLRRGRVLERVALGWQRRRRRQHGQPGQAVQQRVRHDDADRDRRGQSPPGVDHAGHHRRAADREHRRPGICRQYAAR